jgi:hypothetical protein
MDRFNILEIGDTKPVVAPNNNVFGNETGLVVSGEAKQVNGQWVNAIGLASTETHRHVAKVWQDKCASLANTLQEIRTQHEGKFDKTASDSSLRLATVDSLIDGSRISKSGLESIRSYTTVPSTMIDYLIENNFEADVPRYINDAMDKRENKRKNQENRTMLLRFRTDEEGEYIRSVCSEKYGVLDNIDAFEFIADALPNGLSDALTSHFQNDGDDIAGNILLPDYMKEQPDSMYGVGINFSNSEIRNGSFKISPFLFRAICLNGMIWGRRNSEISINQRHLGKIDKDHVKEQVRQAVVLALSEGNDILTLMNLSQGVKVKNVSQVIAKVSRDNKLTIEQGRAWSQGYLDTLKEDSGHLSHESAFGIVNGLTRGAQSFTGALREQMETTASMILAPSIDADLKAIQKRWGTISGSASTLEDKIVQKYQVLAV